MYFCFLSFLSLIFWLLFVKANDIWEHTEESRHPAFVAFKPWVRNLSVLNEITVCGALPSPVLWGGLVTLLLAIAYCYFDTSAVVSQPQQTKISGNEAAIYWGKRDQILAALPVKMSPHIPTSYPVENPCFYGSVTGTSGHLETCWCRPVSWWPNTERFTDSMGTKSILPYPIAHDVSWDREWSKSPGIISNRGTGSNVGFFLWR